MNGELPMPDEFHVQVVCESNLERYARDLNPDGRRALARIYYRWADQLAVSADMMELTARSRAALRQCVEPRPHN